MPIPAAPERWTIGLEAWIIEDGNYKDFECGQIAEFAVSFDYDELQVIGQGVEVAAKQVLGAFYDIVGRVTTTYSEALVVDCGIEMYANEAARPIAQVGQVVGGRVALGLDCYDYFERLYAVEGIPPLVYTWRVESIQEQLTLFGFEELAQGAAPPEYNTVERTHALDDAAAYYLLHCTRLDVSPKRTSVTAIPPMNKR